MTTILIADDCASIRELLRLELEDEGYRVLVARDGREAVEVFEAARPDLAILDIWMPRGNPLEAAERIRAVDPAAPVILFTNHDETCIDDPRSIFAVACVEKGADLTELKQVIVSVVNQRDGSPLFRRGLPPIRKHPAKVPGARFFSAVPRISRNR